MQNKKTFWPYGIALSLCAIIIACIITIIIGTKNPVHMDNFYFEKYQNVENNFFDIQQKDKKFKSEFDFELKNLNLRTYKNPNTNQTFEVLDIKTNKENLLSFKLTPKSNKSINDITIEALLTKPDTNDFNKKLDIATKEDGFDISINPDKIGRWQLMLKLTSSKDSISFYKYELYAN
ncbi:putative lipoprotein [Campylobacter sputorum subsp. bubulus]|uniref:Putative lipoprotein n=1 Tax=Campylobacter sputorum subsp. sputorum TaxID=32024 RepID=A0A381DK43_9BACT|nr:hypothetical protein [Campylobacter sputorum]ASM34376.1 putative cytochrome c oxidase-associated protein CcoH [Campylobacter sputorum aubsp. sputorum RM3237]KAB0582233.1 hypothetical protein F7P64_02885 [Campylobacter sputorum subsp. sputorum]QEL04567.1 putative cytochrome c oxidase-associated protein CcoH [Campylobacter sputorum subsp. sputorum]SUX09343.1 putative lipoprotein [Campylobacter sputorum subsp. bubulus]SUX11036.1 putative lipoprotein [Campylobacter sputorum subsp. sputorum]